MLNQSAVWAILRALPRKFYKDNVLFLAAGLAFHLLLFAVPLSLLVISALGYTLVGSARASAVVSEVLQALLPSSQRAFTEHVSAIVTNRGLLGFVGFVTLFIISHAVFSAVRIVLNIVLEVRKPRRFLHGVGVDFLVMLATAGLVLATVVLTFVLTLVRRLGEALPLLLPLVTPGRAIASALIGFVLTVAIFYLLYRYSPAERLGRTSLVVASVTGGVLLEISKGLFAWYVDLAQAMAGLYGALGGLLFFVLWLYYASIVFLLGAIVGWLYERAHA